MNVRRSNVSRRSAKSSNDQNVSKCKSSSSTRRLMEELSEIMGSKDTSITAFPDDGNIFKWTGKIKGPPGSVYEEMAFKLNLQFPEGYPIEAPTITFATPCYHPNVDMAGNICVDTLKEKWSSCNCVLSILISIQSLLQDPNTASPLNARAASLWEKPEAFKEELKRHSGEAMEVYKEW